MTDDQPQSDFFTDASLLGFPFGLGSDNHSGVHPRILATLKFVNRGFAPSYGTDLVTDEAIRIFKSHFGPETNVYFCFNGTAANVLALSPLVSSFNSILCSNVAHINVDECGAPEKMLGAKLIPISTIDGKLTPELMAPHILRRGDQHFSQVAAVSITQPTELGTLYTREELDGIVNFCERHDLWLHIDGTRFVNAAHQLGLTLSELSQGADSLSFGGTKNGLAYGEAVLFLSPEARRTAHDFVFIRKQLMQLPSKTRFIAAQFIEFLGTDLWKEIAANSCDRARELRRGLEEIKPAIQFTQETRSNAVFAIFDRQLEKAIKKSAFFYVWDEKTRECRLMTSWSTQPSDIASIIDVAKKFSQMQNPTEPA